MKEFIVKHVEEIIGTISGLCLAPWLKIKLSFVILSSWYMHDLHNLAMALLTGGMGGLGAWVVKKLLYKATRKKLKSESE